VAVSELRGIAARHGLSALIAPVRPNWKDPLPLVPIERYAAGGVPTACCSTPG